MINCHVKLKIFEKKEKEKEGGWGGLMQKRPSHESLPNTVLNLFLLDIMIK